MMKKRSAFTLIEILFVIVILGIVSGFALEAIRQYYDGIYRTSEYTKRVAEADHILGQVSKYFEYAVGSSIVNLAIDGTTCYGTPSTADTNDYTVAFVSVDKDTLSGFWNGTRFIPGWSEDMVLGSGNTLSASDANYTGVPSLTTLALFDNDSVDDNACVRFNFNTGDGTSGYHKINSFNSSTGVITLNTDNNASNGKRKYLLKTGYAMRVDDNGTLFMYHNFRPWAAQDHLDGNKSILGHNVAHFYANYDASDFQNNSGLTDRGLVWRLKVCMRGIDSNLSDSDDESNAICRERRVHVRY